MSEALKTLNEAVEMARRNGDRFWVSRLPNCIGWIYRELQDFQRALGTTSEELRSLRRTMSLKPKNDEQLRTTFLKSPAVREVLEGRMTDSFIGSSH